MTKAEYLRLIPLADVADWLSVFPDLIYRLCRSRRLPGVKVGGLWRFRRADVERFIDRQVGPIVEDDETLGA